MVRITHQQASGGALAGLGLFAVVASVLLALSLGSAELRLAQHDMPDLAQRLQSLLAGIRLGS